MEVLWLEERCFCCFGCKTVYEILSANNLCEYYQLDSSPGVKVDHFNKDQFAYLNESAIEEKLLTFNSSQFARVSFYVPAIHCISCIWLLEHLQKIHAGIIKSEVVFARKSVTVDYHPQKISLGELAALLSSVGYAPRINLENEKPTPASANKVLIIKLAIAGFCFGNVMLFSFPEYLGLEGSEQGLSRVFSWLNLALSVPVFFYSGWDYIKAAWQSFRQKQINIDVPIAAGLVALFFRSAYDIVTATGPGYLDSFTGLVFFLLIGRWFQSKTYESLAFDRDFKSYFPLAVNRWNGIAWRPVIIYDLKEDDRMRIRNMEIIPADALLETGHAYIDYSFVTGESKPVKVAAGELIYAGGRLIGEPVVCKVKKQTSQSHLTSLWNNEVFKKKEESRYQKIIDQAARRFTWIVMGIAVMAAVYWQWAAPTQMWLILTSVLMVACPCALALAAPFTYGNMLRVFGRHQLYLKNADVIERMATVDAIVFDKTGTVTYSKEPDVSFNGSLTKTEMGYIKILTGYSTHPLSNIIHHALHNGATVKVENFKELPGKGLEGVISNQHIRLGSASFTGAPLPANTGATYVFVCIDGVQRGFFSIKISIRQNLKAMLKRLGARCSALLSGDNAHDQHEMQELFPISAQMKFNQSPFDKLDFIKTKQQRGSKVMMLGDGLNDAGALKQSDVGLAVTDDTGVFTPACDGILQGDQLDKLDSFIALSQSAASILKFAFAISFFYNAVALTFAVTGHLTPLVAAVLMPISSISVVGFSSLAVRWVAAKKLESTQG
jgi:Cu+-exporting ATPase